MNNLFTGNTTPTDQSDWEAVNAMTDADIHHDADSPHTFASDWDGALLKQGGVVIGKIKAPVKSRWQFGMMLTYWRISVPLVKAGKPE